MRKANKALFVLAALAILVQSGCAAGNEAVTPTETTAAVIAETPTTTSSASQQATTTEATSTSASVPVSTAEEITSTTAETTVATTTAVTTTTVAVTTESESEKSDFIRVSGSGFVDGDGNEYVIKGMAFANQVFDNPSTPPKYHHTAESYKELAEMGFNSVRFYLNYGLFEDDSAPYVYKQSGFDWLDKNIAWAEAAGIKLVLNMHYPQGGYQSQGNGLALWTDEKNGQRLTALWKEIAKRYADEETIIGFGLINEPVLPELGTAEKTIGQCYDLMQKITDAIRTVDDNHIVFIERPISVSEAGHGAVDWSLYSFGTMASVIDDDNVAYEFHFYDPMEFTGQNTQWMGTYGQTRVYGDDDDVLIGDIDNYWVSFLEGKKVGTSGEWERFETDYVSAGSNYNLGMPVLAGYGLGSGAAYYDDITVTEYTADGKATGRTITYDFTDSLTADTFSFWSSDSAGWWSYSADTGCAEAGSICVTGSSETIVMTGSRFALRDGYKYKVSGMVLLTDGGIATVRCDYAHAVELHVLNKEYLDYLLSDIRSFQDKHNVPIYIGEFGVISEGFKENRGGEQWVSDTLELFGKYGFSFNYHTYHEGSFGLYQNEPNELPDDRNELLYEVLREELLTS